MTTIKLKRSSSQGVTPGTEDLELGELAVNTYDGKLFLKKNDGSDSIIEFNPTASTGQTITVNDSSGTSSSALFIDYNVSGDTPELTGDILKRGLFIDVDSSANMGTVDNEHRLYGAYLDVRNTGDSDLVKALRLYQRNLHTAGTTTESIAADIYLSAEHSSTGAVTNLYGIKSVVDQRSANSITEAAGLKVQTNSISTSAGGTTILGADIELQRNGGSWTDAYGVKVLLDENNNNSDAPQVTNSYLIYGSYEGDTMATNEWGLYLPDAGSKNYFGGLTQFNAGVEVLNGNFTFDTVGAQLVFDGDTATRDNIYWDQGGVRKWEVVLDNLGDLSFLADTTNNQNATFIINQAHLNVVLDEPHDDNFTQRGIKLSFDSLPQSGNATLFTADRAAIGIENVVTSTFTGSNGFLQDVYGINTDVRITGSGVEDVWGTKVFTRGDHSTSVNYPNIRGLDLDTRLGGNGGTVSNLFGIRNLVYSETGSSTGNGIAYGVYNDLQLETTTTDHWDNLYGYDGRIDNNGVANSVSGSAFVMRLRYLGNLPSATNNYNLYIDNTANTSNYIGSDTLFPANIEVDGTSSFDGIVDIRNTTAPTSLSTDAALKVAGGMTVQGWTFFNIAGSNVVYDADSSSRQVFDIRRNNDNYWLLTLQSDGDLAFDVNDTNNSGSKVVFDSQVQFNQQIQGEVDINVAGSNLVLNADSSSRQTIDWRQSDTNFWYLNLASNGNLEFEPNATNNTNPRLDIESRAVITESISVIDSSSFAENTSLTINTDLTGNAALSANRVGYGIYVDLDSDFDNSNSGVNNFWLEGIRSDVRCSTPHQLVRGIRNYTQANNSTGTLEDLTGIRSQAIFNGSGTADVQNIYGSLNDAAHYSSIDITGNLFGMRNIVTLLSSAGGANNIYGTYSETQFSGNTLNDIFGVYALIDNNGTGGNATGDAYAFYSRYEGNLPATGAGKNYGIYITDQTGVENFIGGDLTTFSDDIFVTGEIIQNCAGGQLVFDADGSTRTVMRFTQNDVQQFYVNLNNLGHLEINSDTTNNATGEVQFYSEVRNRSIFTNTGDIIGLTANKFKVVKHNQTGFVFTANTITGSDGCFADFTSGEDITITSTTSGTNDGTFTIQSITGSSGSNNVITITANSFTATTDTASVFVVQRRLGIGYDNDGVALSLQTNTAGDDGGSLFQFPDSYGFNAHFSSGAFESFAHRRDFTLHKSESSGSTKGGLWVQEYNSSTGVQLGFDRIFTDSYGGIAEVTANGNTTTNDLTVGSITSTNHASIDGVEIGLAGGSTSATNLAIGAPSGVGRPLEQSTASNNIAIGYEAFENNVDGYESVAVGRGALQDNVNSVRHVAIGYQALRDCGTGGGTSAIGNVAIGWQASVANTTGASNVSVGYAALTGNTDGSQNTAVGWRALDSAVIGDDNTAVGYNALTALASSGAANTVVGSGAGTTLTGGSNNTVLGYNAEPSSATASNEITLGDALVTNFRIPGVDLYATTNGLGINTTGPQKQLSVVQDDSTTDVTGKNLSGGSTGNGIQILNSNTTTGAYANLDFRSGNADGRIAYVKNSADNTGDFVFVNDPITTTTGTARITQAGRIIALEGIQVGSGNITATDANTMDDYEEGTWTPSYFLTTTDFASITMDVLSATYTKIGDTVTIKCWIRTDAVDVTGSSGNLRISGLPFAISGYGGITIGRSEAWTNNVNAGHLVGGTTEIRLYKRSSISAQDNVMTSADMVTGTVANQNNLVFTAIYRTTA